MRRLACLVGLIVLAFGPAVAQADTLDNQLAALRPLVTQWWAGYGLTETTCGSVDFQRTTLPAGSGDEAWLVEGNSIDEYHLWVPTCHIVFSEALTSATPAEVCTVVLHEWGHVLGLPHSIDSTNIMYGGHLVSPPPVCAAWGAPPVKGQPGTLTIGRRPSWRHLRAVMALL